MLYLIQENVFREEHYDLLESSLKRMELPYKKVRVFPFVDKIVDLDNIISDNYNVDDLPDFDTSETNIFPFGALKLARVGSEKGWIPGSLMNDNHDYQVYKDHYKNNLLNFDSKIKLFTDDLDWRLNEVKFIRPCKDTKAFTGRVFNQLQWETFVSHSLNNGHTTILSKDTEIQVSTPKHIQKEIRFWVVGGKVITGSQYRLGSQTIYSDVYEEEAQLFAQKMVDIFQLAEAFVIDVCLTNDEWKIVECGCINCAGFYKSNIPKMLDAVETHFNKNK